MRVLAFVASSQPVLYEGGGLNPASFNYPWHPSQIESFELLGDVELRLTGALTLAEPKKE